MKLGISKKLIGAYGIGLILFLIFVWFSYNSLSSFLSIEERTNKLAYRIELIADLQSFLHKILMPPNDYLITGDKKEQQNFAKLVTETAALLEKIRISENRTKEEISIGEEVEKEFIELQQKAMILLSTENPIGNKKAGMQMEEMDHFAEQIVSKIEKLHTMIKNEIETNKKETFRISSLTYRIFTILIFVSVAGIILMSFLIRKNIAKPLLELTNSANIIGKGNLEHRIKIVTGDEIEGLANEFNKMAQSLKEKIDEVKDYSEKLEKVNRQLDQNILQLYTLYNISKSLTATLEMEKLLNQVVERVSQALKLHKINIMLLNEKSNELSIIAGTGISEKILNVSYKVGEGIYGWSALTGQAEIINDLRKHPRFNPIQGLDDDVSSLNRRKSIQRR